ncbi:hypothetical protein DEU56DRAFT_779587 [Suillus clintonianus]|uniref:uncharacterized protein n=1 Tax=Suillus clintonianus TaxID=1904413 RepID=UPI001B881DA5|nr:uncharacterized protein DEU56DRAFT_779587 [Suillus clintonianus]KAG2150363.1 hypothetical protein DEU56DRAFT_779587 [Suillus clintonianus]
MKKSYVVVVGLRPGIYPNWIECHGQIKDVPGAVHQSFETHEEALAVWNGALQRGEVEAVRANAGAASASTARTRHRIDGSHMFQPVAPSRVDRSASDRALQSRQTLWDDVSLLRSPYQTLRPEPPTGVTQYEDLEDDPLFQSPRRLSPRVTVEDTSYTSSCMNEVSHLLMKSRPAHIRRVEASPASSMMSVEETLPRVLHRHPTAPASFETGARYPTLEEIRKGEDLDPRVMIPPSRTFDPGNVKPRPGAVSARRKNDQMDAESTNPRTTRLVRGLPAVDYSEDDGQSISSLPRRRVVNKGKSRALADDAIESLRASGYISSNNRHSFSEYSYHVQEVYSVERPEQPSVVVVHCPPGCRHGHCASASASTPVLNERVHSRYVDAGVSPILSSVSSARKKASVRDLGARVSDASSEQEFFSFSGFSSTPQVSHRSYGVESDVRSPFARGMRVPSDLSELSTFGRPSPVMQGSPVRDRHRRMIISQA